MTAEEIFNMFFGGGFPTHTVNRGGMRFRQQAHFQRHFHNQHQHHGDGDNRREVTLAKLELLMQSTKTRSTRGKYGLKTIGW